MISLNDGVQMYTECFEELGDLVIFDHPDEGLAILIRKPCWFDGRLRKYTQVRFPIGRAILGDLSEHGVLAPLVASAVLITFGAYGIMVKMPDVSVVCEADLARAFTFFKSLEEGV